MKKIILLSICLLIGFYAVAQSADTVIILDQGKEVINIGEQVYLLEDKEAKLSIEDILKPAHQASFKKSEAKIPNFTATKSKIWVKFTVSNQIEEKIYLEIGTALAWYIDFYKPNDKGNYVLSTQTGMMRPIKNREIDNNLFLFELTKNSTPQTYYFSIQSDFTLTIPLLLGTAGSFYEYRYPYIVFFGMFWGLMIVMFLYNLFIYFSVRDSIYLYYCGYLLTALFILNFVSGNYAYRWNIISYFSNYLFLFSLFHGLFTILFLLSIMKVKRRQLFFKINIGYLSLFFLFMCINIITGRYILFKGISDFCVILHSLYVFFYSISQYKRGNTAARFVVFGFSFYLIGLSIVLFQASGIIFPINFFTRNAVVIGSSFEIVLFSLALADRINIMRREQIVTQASLLVQIQANKKMVEDQNVVLEKTVTEKTKDLQIAYEEIQVSNKELEQQKEYLEISNAEIRKAKTEIEAQAEELQKLNHFKDRLFSILAHDLRSPMATLQGTISILDPAILNESELTTIKNELTKQFEVTDKILQDLLQWTKDQMQGETINTKLLNLDEIVNDKLNLFATIAQSKNINLLRELMPDIQVFADENHVNIILQNLLSNALKFTYSGGTITIKSQKIDKMLQITVKDTGKGMNEEQQNKLFSAQHFTTKGTAGEKGNGLGLHLVKDLVEKNGGKIWVESVENKGSIFTFSLPIVSA